MPSTWLSEYWPYLVAGVLLAMVVTLFIFNGFDTRRRELLRAEMATRDYANILAEHAGRAFEAIDLALESANEVSSDLNNGEIGAVEAAARLAAIRGASPVLRAVVLFDSGGQLAMASTASESPRAALAIPDRNYFVFHRDNSTPETHIAAPVRGRDRSGEWILPVTRRLNRPDGSFDGLVLGAARPGYFSDFYNRIGLGNSGYVRLVDRDGTILAHEPGGDDFIGRHDEASPASFGGGKPSHATYLIDPVDGIERIVSRAAVQNRGVEMVVATGVDDVVREWRRDFGVRSVLMVLFVMLIIGTAWILRRKVVIENLYRRELEAATMAAEDANRSKTAFLANMSHELRTPLNAIIGFSDLLARDIYGATTPKQREAVDDIATAGRHLLGVINTLLDISKIEAGHVVLKLEPVELDEVIGDAMRLSRPLAAAAGVALHLEVEPMPPVHGDRRALYQIMVNLLSNAIKFTPKGGEIHVSAAAGADGVTVTVRDTGIGIAAGDLARVVQPYHQVENQVAREHKGTGLGLPLARQLAELHDAKFTLESEVGRGTTVTMVIPPGRLLGDLENVPIPPT